MALPDLDPRNGGTCANCMAKKFTCAVVAVVQVIVWGLSLLALIFAPSSAGAVVEELDTIAQVVINCAIIACFGFSCLLVAGVFKNNRLYVKIYLIYVAVYIMILIILLIVNICVQPQVVGFKGFLSTVICILLFILFFFVVRSYYLNTYCSSPRRQAGTNKI